MAAERAGAGSGGAGPSRRALLGGAGLVALGAACGGSDSPRRTAPPDGFVRRDLAVDGGVLQALVPAGGLAPDGAAAPPVLVLLHGYPATASHWAGVLPELARIGRPVAVDLPGVGGSTGLGALPIAVAAARVRDGVRQLSSAPVVLVGDDLGCWVAAAWARDFPADVAGVVATEGVVPGFDEGAFTSWHIGFAQVPGLPEALLAGRLADWFGWFWASAGPGALSAEDRDDALAAYRGADGAAGLSYYRALAEEAERHRVAGRSAVRVLALGGAAGVADRVQRSWSAVSGQVSGAVIPAAGHWVVREQPQRWLDEVRGFCSGLGS